MWIGIGVLVLAIIITIIAVQSNKKKKQAERDAIPPPAPPIFVEKERVVLGGVQYIAPSKRETGTAFIRIAQGSEPPEGTLRKGKIAELEDAGDYSGQYKISDVWSKDGKDSGFFITSRTVSETIRPGGKIYLL